MSNPTVQAGQISKDIEMGRGIAGPVAKIVSKHGFTAAIPDDRNVDNRIDDARKYAERIEPLIRFQLGQ